MADVVAMQWRPIADARRYMISECGDIKSGSRRLRGFIDQDGYLKYAIFFDDGVKRCVFAHRLVAETYIGPAPSSCHEVAHNNGSRIANHFKNLRWATRIENDADTIIHDTTRAGERNGRAKISNDDVVYIRRTYKAIKNRQMIGKISDLAASFGLHHATLISIAKGKSWSHIPMSEAD